ncbi:MAG: tetratricopeptide repeat protein [Pseudorhodoplanes sp.]
MLDRLVLAIAIALVAPGLARAQSADLVLCDRLAADPADLDKPRDVKGVNEIASSDVATAIKFCKTASGSSRRAMFALGRAYAAGGQTQEAVAAYRRAADKGSTAAMVELGVMYASGNGVPKDEAQARKLLDRAAQAGDPRGVANLMTLGQKSGAAAPADPVKARAILQVAAERNSAEAQYQLGLMNEEGVGGPKDEASARSLFERAAAQNHPAALERAGAYAERGLGGPQDKDAAKGYYEKAAGLGSEEAKTALKRLQCPYVLRDKRGAIISHLCF